MTTQKELAEHAMLVKNRAFIQLFYKFGTAESWVMKEHLYTTIKNALSHVELEHDHLFVYDQDKNLLLTLPVPIGEWSAENFTKKLQERIFKELVK